MTDRSPFVARIKSAWAGYYWPMAVKLGVFFTLPLVVALAFLGWWQQWTLTQLIEEQTQAFGQALVSQIAHSAAELVLAEDMLALQVMLSGIVQKSPIKYAVIYGHDHTLLVEAKISNLEQVSKVLALTRFVHPIQYQDLIVGELSINIDVSLLDAAMRQSKKQFFLAQYWVMLTTLVLTLLMARFFIKPLQWLRESAQRIASGQV